MQTYIGYGFNVNDITDEQWLNLVEKYNDQDFIDFLEENEALNCDAQERIGLAQEYLDCNHYNGNADALCDIINSEEGLELVWAYDNYIVFGVIDFFDHYKKRALRIKNREEFIELIAKYIPLGNIKFGNVFTGEDWIDPTYYLEEDQRAAEYLSPAYAPRRTV